MNTTFYCRLPLTEVIKIIKNIYYENTFDEYTAGDLTKTLVLGRYYIRASQWVFFFIVLHEENERTAVHISTSVKSNKETVPSELLFSPKRPLGSILADIGLTYDFFKPFTEEIADYVEY